MTCGKPLFVPTNRHNPESRQEILHTKKQVLHFYQQWQINDRRVGKMPVEQKRILRVYNMQTSSRNIINVDQHLVHVFDSFKMLEFQADFHDNPEWDMTCRR